ncbi:cell wall protein [Bacillus cereus]|uniref:LPXTG cell wall anchor domain-containing protein n=1 Tax=Bacillus cereus TaxID=1396 RepID=UPI000BF68B71|nr:LPXTG cell wall anchor domain-containing protein [Bacillus cereus]PEX06528.1 cell wall protein [Bacillus cereus]PGV20721.1 cell wall protein [Bacillus cereus]
MERKRLLIFFGILIMCLSIPVSSHAAESQDYQSNGQVSFFGKYINPDHEKPLEPGDSSEAGNGHTGENSVSGEQNNQNLGKIPQTGDASYLGVKIFGILFIVLTFYWIHKYKKFQWSESL